MPAVRSAGSRPARRVLLSPDPARCCPCWRRSIPYVFTSASHPTHRRSRGPICGSSRSAPVDHLRLSWELLCHPRTSSSSRRTCSLRFTRGGRWSPSTIWGSGFPGGPPTRASEFTWMSNALERAGRRARAGRFGGHTRGHRAGVWGARGEDHRRLPRLRSNAAPGDRPAGAGQVRTCYDIPGPYILTWGASPRKNLVR